MAFKPLDISVTTAKARERVAREGKPVEQAAPPPAPVTPQPPAQRRVQRKHEVAAALRPATDYAVTYTFDGNINVTIPITEKAEYRLVTDSTGILHGIRTIGIKHSYDDHPTDAAVRATTTETLTAIKDDVLRKYAVNLAGEPGNRNAAKYAHCIAQVITIAQRIIAENPGVTNVTASEMVETTAARELRGPDPLPNARYIEKYILPPIRKGKY